TVLDLYEPERLSFILIFNSNVENFEEANGRHLGSCHTFTVDQGFWNGGRLFPVPYGSSKRS
ncbi:hypothetical protein P7M45_23775, partial [Vibrio parahaemolyticus]|nr:hypothetical protein [Vibrio parahaemolyticus]